MASRERRQQSSSSSHPRQCPCKLLPQCLSSFTAAEYGDLHSLSTKPDVAHKVGLGGLTPLHYAAQNDKASSTAYLLGLGANVDGRPRLEDMSISVLHQNVGSSSSGRTETKSKEAWCGATPLHRAAFSGAVSAMQILLEWGSGSSAAPTSNAASTTSRDTSRRQCDILAQDTSFGDKMTPLHKAAAGGRPLAVQLLVETLRSRNHQEYSYMHEESDLLRRGLTALDSQGRTPLEVAKAIDPLEEAKSVKRWDSVAGGGPDWTRCIAILEHAEQEAGLRLGENVDTTCTSTRTRDADLPALPSHLLDTMSCLDCGADGGVCKTASWEAAFREVLTSSAMQASAQTSIANVNIDVASDGSGSAAQKAKGTQSVSEIGAVESKPNTISSPNTTGSSTSSPRVGHKCNACEEYSVALFRGAGGMLVCKKCRGQSRRKNVITVVKM